MFRSLVRIARPAQWLKNGIVFAGLIFAGEAGHVWKVELAIAAAAIFCLLSSAVYIINDIVDREKDRQHPLKRERPLAAGALSVGTAAGVAVSLVVVSLIGAWFMNLNFFYVSVAFLTLNLIYSFWSKNIVILDVMSIAFSFVIRAYAGAVAIDVPASKWLLLNTFFLALFLAFGKRRHELVLLDQGATEHRSILGQYSPYLLDQLIALVTASTVVMYMLYTFSSEVMEKLGTSNLYLTIPFVVYGVFRYLYLIHKREMGGSPTRILIDDRPLLVNVILWLITVFVVMY